MAEGVRGGGEPALVAKVIAAAATDAKPTLRYAASAMARRAGMLHRFAPAQVFDKQIRELDELAG
ncbi:hypothetical protein GCM10009863_40320 [Streptomyces axinellae]|jgi:hypothetical protein|uniref:Uncharacterized protein n=2 Tax=Streptomyces axinellae TaxID=552788 RepID=A0ABN3QBR7_9ACTN